MTNPKKIVQLLHLVRAGLASGLLTKEDVVDWACKIVAKDEKPDIFFIDLALSSSKSINTIIRYFSDYLNFESPIVQGRPLLALLYRQFYSGQLTLEQTVRKLYHLKSEACFTGREERYIYSINNDFDCANDNIYGTIEDVYADVNKFLSFYKDYPLLNLYQCDVLDLNIGRNIDENINIQQEECLVQAATESQAKPWWKFW